MDNKNRTNGAAKIATVRIADLLRDPSFQVRHKIDPGTVHRYATALKSGSEFPPIKVAVVDGAPVVVDGWHRIAACETLGRTEVDAEVVEASSPSAARWMAAKANLAHGLSLKKSELRRVYRAYIEAGQHMDRKRLKSYREIAKDLPGASYTTIRNWMRQDHPALFKRMGGSEPNDTGGIRELPATNGFAAMSADALDNALAAFRGVTDPVERGRIIERAERLVAEMRDAGPWEPPEPSDF